MTKDNLQNILSQACNELGITLSKIQENQIIAYVEELEKWNKVYNLTAIKNREEIMKRHVIDALSIYPHIQRLLPSSLADIGTGGGVPGIILSIMFPNLPIDLVESIGKKCRFLRHIIHKLSLPSHVVVQQKRVQDWQPETIKSILICRAFTSLENFITTTQHLGNNKTYWLAMKSAHTTEEEKSLPNNYTLVDNRQLTVPFEVAKRHLITLKRH